MRGGGQLLDLYKTKKLSKVLLQNISINIKNTCLRKYSTKIYNYEYALNLI